MNQGTAHITGVRGRPFNQPGKVECMKLTILAAALLAAFSVQAHPGHSGGHERSQASAPREGANNPGGGGGNGNTGSTVKPNPPRGTGPRGRR